MAATIYELQETRSLSQTSGRVSGSRKFAIWDDATAITEPSTIRFLFGGGSLPDLGDVFPGETNVYAVSYAIDHQADSRGVWHCAYSYENTEAGTAAQPQEPGFVEFSIDYSTEFRSAYRINPSFNGAPNGAPDNTDIGGVAIDSAGEPLTTLVHFASVVIGETVLASTLQSRLLTTALVVGARNSSVFQGFAKGTLVYMGASASRIAVDKYTMSHRFNFDGAFHMHQTPDRDQNREVICVKVGGINRAQNVRFVQPFPVLLNFNALSENF